MTTDASHELRSLAAALVLRAVLGRIRVKVTHPALQVGLRRSLTGHCWLRPNGGLRTVLATERRL